MGDAERCNCLYCRNFLRARNFVYPPDVLGLFRQVGIDYRKESETFYLNREHSGLHSYGGWFHIIGNLPPKSEGVTANENLQFTSDEETFIWILSSDIGPHHNAFDGYSLVEFYFLARIPWVLNELASD